MTYRRWDVVAVNYPFIEGDAAKRRPALVVSTDEFRARHGCSWVVMITTARAGARSDDVAIPDHTAAGLPEACVIRIARLTTLSDSQIAYRLGTIGARERRAVAALLKKYLP